MLARTFIAVNVTNNIRKDLGSVLNELRELGVYTTQPRNLHFTLKFLGELRQDKIAKTIDTLSKIEFSPFKIKLRGVGAFPNEEYVRIVWAGVQSKGLGEFAKKINLSLKDVFTPESFTPHLTLGRVKKKLILDSFFRKYKDYNFGSFKAESFELMQSAPGNEGPVYSVIWSSASELD